MSLLFLIYIQQYHRKILKLFFPIECAAIFLWPRNYYNQPFFFFFLLYGEALLAEIFFPVFYNIREDTEIFECSENLYVAKHSSSKQ